MTLEEELTAYIMAEIMSSGNARDLGPNDDLIGSGILDSLAMIKLVTHLEQQYGVALQPEEMTMENLGSIAALVRLVEARR